MLFLFILVVISVKELEHGVGGVDDEVGVHVFALENIVLGACAAVIVVDARFEDEGRVVVGRLYFGTELLNLVDGIMVALVCVPVSFLTAARW